MAKKTQGMSLNPEDFTGGGGLLDDVNVTFNKARFKMFDYQGKFAATPSLMAELEDDEGEETEQYWSMGNAQDWAPSTDGKELVAVGSATGIRSSSNGAIFIKSLVDSGFPEDKLGVDISVLEGMQAHVIRIPEPKRNLKRSKAQKEREEQYGPPTVLVVDEIITMPWDKKKSKGAPKGKGKGKGKAAGKGKGGTTGDDLTEKAQETVMAIVLEEGEVNKKKLPTLVFQALKKDADRNAIAKLVFDDDFLGSGEWAYDEDSGVLSVG